MGVSSTFSGLFLHNDPLMTLPPHRGPAILSVICGVPTIMTTLQQLGSGQIEGLN